MILAGDIGATKTYLGFFDRKLNNIVEAEYKSANYQSIGTLINQFLRQYQIDSSTITAIGMGVAGPVINGCCELTNVEWTPITVEGLSQLCHGAPAALLNDLEAIGYGIPLLKEDELISINPNGVKRTGNAGLIAAGTGLGEALLYWDESKQQFYPSSSEGSHVNFGPRNQEEIELLRYLMQLAPSTHQCVSYEQIVSGMGLINIYEFLKSQNTYQEPEWLKIRFEQQGQAATISEVAIAKENVLCEKALDMFVSIFGAEAGNLALKYLALSGIYIGGGIAPKILSKLIDGTFMQAFTDKEKNFAQLTMHIPVYIIINSKTGLLGAAWCAANR